jgi:CNT family concentrative nucleoside transporter
VLSAAHSLLGLACFLLLAVALSRRRQAIRPRAVLAGVALQAALTLLLLRVPAIAAGLLWLSGGVAVLQAATDEGARFMFGYLAGGPQPFATSGAGSDFIVAFRVLPLILVVSAISAVLFHLRVLPWLIGKMARGLQKSLGLSGPLGFGAAASVFLGIIEGPLFVRPYLAAMPAAELFALMTCGMATVAGTVMVLYASIVEPVLPGALASILVASLISVPAALTVAHLMDPAEHREADDALSLPVETESWIEALMDGISEGTRVVIDVAATIVVLFALVSLLNAGLALLPAAGGAPVTLQRGVGWLLTPLVWLMGMPWSDAVWCAERMGTKTVLNEFVAYMELAAADGGPISARSREILVFAMCGFANLGSMGILAGGLGSIVPSRRAEIAALAGRALVAGTLATMMTGAMVGLLGGL